MSRAMMVRRHKNDTEREAIFHGWGVDYEEFESGPGNFSVAIVEYPGGEIGSVAVGLVRFVVPTVEHELALAHERYKHGGTRP